MSDKLFKRLEERFPPWNGADRVHCYEAYERIYLFLPSEEIKARMPKDVRLAKMLDDHDAIERLAERVFDVPFAYETRGGYGPALWFEPRTRDEYSQRHFAHHLYVSLPNLYAVMTLDLGNRGNGALFDQQRDNYFLFVEGVYLLFVQHADTLRFCPDTGVFGPQEK